MNKIHVFKKLKHKTENIVHIDIWDTEKTESQWTNKNVP